MKYVTPEIDLIALQSKDVVTASELGVLSGEYGDSVSWGSGTLEER